MTEHAGVTNSTGWTHCRRCRETWPCLEVQLESRRRGRLAIALLAVFLTFGVVLAVTLVLTP